MSIEAKLDALTKAIDNLSEKLGNFSLPQQQPVVQEQVAPAPAPPVVEPAPVQEKKMPEPPSFMTPEVPAVEPKSCPFNDSKGLIQYVMEKYKALGPQKGAQIQGVLNTLGYANINEVKSEHYQQLYSGIEAL